MRPRSRAGRVRPDDNPALARRQCRRVAVPVPGAVVRAGVELAVRLLPGLDDRVRYRAEFAADLAVLGPAGRLRYVAGVLSRIFALRAALGSTPTRAEEDAMTAPTTRPRFFVRCRVLRMHDWVSRSAEDGSRFLACRRCGREKGEVRWGPDNTIGA